MVLSFSDEYVYMLRAIRIYIFYYLLIIRVFVRLVFSFYCPSFLLSFIFMLCTFYKCLQKCASVWSSILDSLRMDKYVSLSVISLCCSLSRGSFLTSVPNRISQTIDRSFSFSRPLSILSLTFRIP